MNDMQNNNIALPGKETIHGKSRIIRGNGPGTHRE